MWNFQLIYRVCVTTWILIDSFMSNGFEIEYELTRRNGSMNAKVNHYSKDDKIVVTIKRNIERNEFLCST